MPSTKAEPSQGGRCRSASLPIRGKKTFGLEFIWFGIRLLVMRHRPEEPSRILSYREMMT